ncbi:MAG: hypothetical protein L7S64_00780, partial [Longimicrobiales bacterium]|nr:hypothetical protein [Longimicrobiales bacterium]
QRDRPTLPVAGTPGDSGLHRGSLRLTLGVEALVDRCALQAGSAPVADRSTGAARGLGSCRNVKPTVTRRGHCFGEPPELR